MSDPVGPARDEADLQAIVLTQETIAGGEIGAFFSESSFPSLCSSIVFVLMITVTRTRAQLGLSPLAVVIAPFVDHGSVCSCSSHFPFSPSWIRKLVAYTKEKMSSTFIRSLLVKPGS